jgi:hypothetical protein
MTSLLLHICTGLGLALAAGIRPFTPALAVGGLAGAGVLSDFQATPYARGSQRGLAGLRVLR